MITSYGFKVSKVEDCIYKIINEIRFIIFLMYVDNILIATNDVGLLCDTKKLLSEQFKMKDLGEISYVLGIRIHQDRSLGILGLLQKSYMDKVLVRFGMNN